VNNKIESSKQVDNKFESAATVHMGGKNTKEIDNVVEPDNMLTETQIAEQVEIMVGHGLEIRLRSKINGQWKVVKTGLRDRAQAESVRRRMATDMDSLRIDGWKDEEMMASIVVKWGKETEKEGKAQRRVQSYPIYTLAEVEAQLAYERAYEKERCGTHVLLQPQINSEWTMGPGTVASHLESTKLGPPGEIVSTRHWAEGQKFCMGQPAKGKWVHRKILTGNLCQGPPIDASRWQCPRGRQASSIFEPSFGRNASRPPF
jgi:hypothetical protein